MKSITTILLVVFYSFLVYSQEDKKQIYFSDSLFCLIKINKKDTLWHIVKDGYKRDSIESWSFGTIKQKKSEVQLNCFLTYNHKNNKFSCSDTLWTKTISQNEFLNNTERVNKQSNRNLLPEIISKFTSDFYRYINLLRHHNVKIIRAYQCFDIFLDYFQNDSLKFISKISHYLDSTNINFYKRAKNNFENKNYEKALFYSKLYNFLPKYPKTPEHREKIFYVYEGSTDRLWLLNEYCLYNQYNHFLIDKFNNSKHLYPKAVRFSKDW